MKKKLTYLLVAALLLGLWPAMQAGAATGEKAVKFTATSNGAGIFAQIQSIQNALTVGDEVIVTVLNSGDASVTFYVRTDVSWASDTILQTPTITLAPGESAELHCAYNEGFNHLMLMTAAGTAGTLTICNLTEADANTLKAAIGGEVIASPEIAPILYQRKPASLPAVGGGSLLFSNRNHRCSGPKQDIKAILEANGQGQYYISGWVRLKEAESRGVRINLGAEIKAESTHWPMSGEFIISDTEWTYISATINITWTNSLTSAILFTQTLYNDMPSGGNSDESAYKEDIEWDAFSLNYIDKSTGVAYSQNLLMNPDCNCDRIGATPGWSVNQGGVLTNPTFDGFDFSGVENSDGSITYENGLVPATDKNIKYVGRWLKQSDNSYKGSFEGYCEIKFTGTQISILTPSSGNAYVQLDGGTPTLVSLARSYKISDLTEGEHTLRIYAQAQVAFPQIGGFLIDENAKTLPSEKKPIIEFVGDSITEGYVVGNNSYMNSYAHKTGQLLGWDYNTVAFGGITMTPGYGSPDTMGMLNRYFVEREYISGDTADTVIPAWDTTRFVPDYMVINLGTNDWKAPADEFIAAYTDFLEKIQQTYPDITIFVMTPFNGMFAAQIRTIAAQFKDKNVILIDSAAWGIPGGEDNLHPDADSHDVAAQKLYEAITAALDPTVTPTPTPTSTPEPTPSDPKGVEITLSTDISKEAVLSLNGLKGFIDTAKKTASITVYNTGDSSITFRAGVRATGSKSWPVIGKDTGEITVAPGESKVITIEGLQDSVVNDLGDTLTAEDYFMILMFTSAQKDGKLTVSGFTADSISSAKINSSFAKVAAVYTLPGNSNDTPKNDGDALRIGFAAAIVLGTAALLCLAYKKKKSIQ